MASGNASESDAGTSARALAPELRQLDGRVELLLEVDGPASEHSTFWLENPKRYVIDVHGRQSAFAQASYELANPLIHRVRVGRHPDKVRFVLDVDGDATLAEEPRPDGNALVVSLESED